MKHRNRAIVSTEAMIISSPATEDTPIRATIRMGTMAKHLVKKFQIHGFNRRSRMPCNVFFQTCEETSEHLSFFYEICIQLQILTYRIFYSCRGN